MTIALFERLVYWQRQLRLQDWDLTVEYGDRHSIQGNCALTNVMNASKEARIRILPESEWQALSERTGTYDEELFLVHELVHLHLEAWGGEARTADTLEWQAKESAIDLIASALLRLERGERR